MADPRARLGPGRRADPPLEAAGDRWRGGGPRAWTAVVLLSALFVLSYVDRLALVVLIEPLKQELGVSDVQVGLLVGTSFAVVSLLFVAPLSRAADLGNRRLLVAAGAFTWTLMTLACGLAPGFWPLLLFRMGVAIGEAVLMPCAMSMIGDLFPRERRATPTSFFILCGGIGASGAVLATGALLDLVSSDALVALTGGLAPWRLTLVALGAIGLAVAALFLALVREPPRRGAGEPKVPLSELARHVAENRRTYAGFIGAGGINALNNLGVIAWYPSHLIRAYGMTPQEVGYVFGAASMAATALGCLLVPLAAARLNARGGRHDGPIWVALAAVLIFCPLMILSLQATTPGLSMAIMTPAFLLQIGVGALITGTMPMLPPPRLRAQVMAMYLLVTGAASLGLGPLLVALLSERLFPGPAGVGSAMAALLALLTPAQVALLIWSRRAFAVTAERAARQEAPQAP